MNRIRLILLLTILLPAGAVAGTPSTEQAELSLADLQGQQHALADYRGKILIVNFWATWCGPCKHEMPLFSDALKHYGDERVQVIAISLDDNSTRGKIPAFAEKQKMSSLILLGNTEAMKKLGLGEAVPATAFIDGEGRVVAKILGEVSKSELKRRLDWMTGQKSGQEPPVLINNLNKKHDDAVMLVVH